MEYADGGTLAQALAGRKIPDYFPERYIVTVFEQISSAINYMHDENILHRLQEYALRPSWQISKFDIHLFSGIWRQQMFFLIPAV